MSVGGFVTRHRGPVLVGLVLVVIAAVTVVTILAGTSDTSDPPSAAVTTLPVAPDDPAAELARLVERGPSVNVDVAYTGNTASTTFNTRLWRRSPLARLDTETGPPEARDRNAQVITTSGPVACTQKGPAPWVCAPKPGLRIADLGVASPAVVSALSKVKVSVRDDRVLGEEVRCFKTAPTDGPATTTPPAPGTIADAELCLTSDGIPVRVDAGSTRLEAVSLNRGRVPDSVFAPPA